MRAQSRACSSSREALSARPVASVRFVKVAMRSLNQRAAVAPFQVRGIARSRVVCTTQPTAPPRGDGQWALRGALKVILLPQSSQGCKPALRGACRGEQTGSRKPGRSGQRNKPIPGFGWRAFIGVTACQTAGWGGGAPAGAGAVAPLRQLASRRHPSPLARARPHRSTRNHRPPQCPPSPPSRRTPPPPRRSRVGGREFRGPAPRAQGQQPRLARAPAPGRRGPLTVTCPLGAPSHTTPRRPGSPHLPVHRHRRPGGDEARAHPQRHRPQGAAPKGGKRQTLPHFHPEPAPRLPASSGLPTREAMLLTRPVETWGRRAAQSKVSRCCARRPTRPRTNARPRARPRSAAS
jgi:hypothetical protein